jgi:hypothetical protein
MAKTAMLMVCWSAIIMDNLAERIRRVIVDLQAVQYSLTRDVAYTAPHGAEGNAYRPDIEEIKRLKDVVDNMRTVLWSYFESAARHDGHDFGDTLQTLRMQRTTEMLHAMNLDMQDKPLPDAAETRSFFEALQQVASVVVDRHMPQTVRQREHSDPGTEVVPEE